MPHHDPDEAGDEAGLEEALRRWTLSAGVAWTRALVLCRDHDLDLQPTSVPAQAQPAGEARDPANNDGGDEDDEDRKAHSRAHGRDAAAAAAAAATAATATARYLAVAETLPEADTRLVSVPLTLLVTAERAFGSARVGPYLRELAETYGLDERLAILLYLVFERAAGPASEIAPWLALWPRTFSTPVYYGPTQWAALAGTQLYLASKSKLSTLLTEYDALRADAGRGLAGTAAAADLDHFTLEAWIWADAIFRTRVCEGPFQGAAHAAGTSAPDGPGEPPAPADASGGGFVAAIIPVVDFANHGGASANARWQVDADTGYVHLVSNRPLAAGEEVRINYGDKGSEELLYQYGFTLPDNPFERVVLLPPLATADEALTEQLELIRLLGVPPRLIFQADGDVANAMRIAPPVPYAVLLGILTLSTDDRATLLDRLEAPDLAPENAFERLSDANELAARQLLLAIVSSYHRDLDPSVGRQRSRSQEAAELIFPPDDQDSWTSALPPISPAEGTRRLLDVQRYRSSQLAVLHRVLQHLKS